MHAQVLEEQGYIKVLLGGEVIAAALWRDGRISDLSVIDGATLKSWRKRRAIADALDNYAATKGEKA